MKIQAHTRELSLDSPCIMGILNVNDDSFYDGGKYLLPEKAIHHAEEMVSQGADIIDIGAESSRPGAEGIDERTEMDRVIPLVRELVNRDLPVMLSIDTVKAEVARAALAEGAHIINDINGLGDKAMRDVIKEYRCPAVMMHIQGSPRTMQHDPRYKDVIQDIHDYFIDRLDILETEGIRPDSIILDPGIGFGKTLEHNIRIINELDSFSNLGLPLLVGASRKSMIGTILGQKDPAQRLTGTLMIHHLSLLNGASILRVHDVKEHSDLLKMHNAMQKPV